MSLLDALDFAPGWKSAVIGFLWALMGVASEVLVYAGQDPLPDSLMGGVNKLALAGITLAIVLKVRRTRRDPMAL